MSDYDKRRQLEELACELSELEKRIIDIRVEITTLLLPENVGNEFVSINWSALKNWAKPSTSE